MTADRNLDLMLVSYFEELAAPPAPADLLGRVTEATAKRRPRPQWLATLRSAQVVRLAGRPMTVPQLGRLAGLAVVALAVLLAGTLLAGLALRQAFPSPAPPFGPARNGPIVFSDGEDLYFGDIDSGARRLIARDAGFGALVSRDGTKVATLRFYDLQTGKRRSVEGCYSLGRQTCTFEAVITSVDGTTLAVLAAMPNEAFIEGWSPDGGSLLIRGMLGFNAQNRSWVLSRYPIDGSVPTELAPTLHTWIGPGEGSIWITMTGRDVATFQALRLDGTPEGIPIALPDEMGFDGAAISPDGLRIAVVSMITSAEGPPPGAVEDPSGRLVIMRRDGTIERDLMVDEGLQTVEFSPDGRWLVIDRTDLVNWTSVVIPADGTWSPTTLGAPGDHLSSCHWSPDGGSLACLGAGAVYLADPQTGAAKRTPWSTDTLPFGIQWQRLAP